MNTDQKPIVPCPKCGQPLRLPSESQVILRCPRCQHSWEEANAVDLRQHVAKALCLVKSGDSESRDEGMRLFKHLYDNREKYAANLWQGIKIMNVILTIILLPDKIAEAGERLRELTE